MTSQEPEIKNHIRRLRFDHGEMTQDQLAKQAGVTRHTIMALEAGKYFPSLLLAFRIARVFGAPVEQVFEYRAAEPNLCMDYSGQTGSPR
jgi:putative transcriptional regulator